jgi:hypothetical protein
MPGAISQSCHKARFLLGLPVHRSGRQDAGSDLFKLPPGLVFDYAGSGLVTDQHGYPAFVLDSLPQCVTFEFYTPV